VGIDVIVPWQPGCRHREAAWRFLRPRWEQVGEVIEGRCVGPWVKAEAVADALTRSTSDVLVIADADVWVDPSDAVAACETWAVPHLKVHRLSEQSTQMVLEGADWCGLALDRSNGQDRRPYRGQLGGGVTVIRRDVYVDCPIPRIEGWGQEDEAWAIALQCLYGKPWRGDRDLVHLWHPPQQRASRTVGSDAGRRIRERYRCARRNPTAMRELVKETAWLESC
jgi:hypothetical protein